MFCPLVLAVLVKFLFQFQQLVHDSEEALGTDALLLLGKEFVDFLDLLVHLLSLVDRLHDLFQRVELYAAQLVLVILVYQLLDLLVWEVNVKAAKQILELTCGDGSIAILVEQLEGLPVFLLVKANVWFIRRLHVVNGGTQRTYGFHF